MLFLSSLANLSTEISSIITTKCVIFDNLSHTTKIIFFSTTNSNFIVNFITKCVHSFSEILFIINFPAKGSV